MNDFSHMCHGLLSVGGGRPDWAGVVLKGLASTFETGIPLRCLDRLTQDSPKAACSILYVSAPVFPQTKTEIDAHTLLNFLLHCEMLRTLQVNIH